MAANTNISWATHTLNFWTGCEEVGPACDDCYAKRWAMRAGKSELWDGVRLKTKTWGDADKFNRLAIEAARRDSIFSNSLSDFLDNHPAVAPWRTQAWGVIARNRAVDWYLVSKRIPNFMRMIPDQFTQDHFGHVVLIATVVTQDEWDRDGPRLKAIKERFPWLRVGLSVEPMLSLMYLGECGWLDWVICGGESGGKDKARPMNPIWARYLRDQCADAGVPFHFKQFGTWEPVTSLNVCRDHGYFDGNEFKRVKSFPVIYGLRNTTTIMQSVLPPDQHANNLLDGREYTAGPRKVAR